MKTDCLQKLLAKHVLKYKFPATFDLLASQKRIYLRVLKTSNKYSAFANLVISVMYLLKRAGYVSVNYIKTLFILGSVSFTLAIGATGSSIYLLKEYFSQKDNLSNRDKTLKERSFSKKVIRVEKKRVETKPVKRYNTGYEYLKLAVVPILQINKIDEKIANEINRKLYDELRRQIGSKNVIYFESSKRFKCHKYIESRLQKVADTYFLFSSIVDIKSRSFYRIKYTFKDRSELQLIIKKIVKELLGANT